MELKARFEALFPAIAHMLREIKRRDYRLSVWLMQNAEATLFIHRIYGRLRKEQPDLIAFTIHDSLLVPPADAAYVESVILDEFARLRIHPTLRWEECAAPEAALC